MPALVLDGVSKRYRRPGGRRQQPGFALRNANLVVGEAEVVAIVGRNGAGKSTLVKVAAGVTAPTEGRVERGGRVAPLIEVGAGFHPELSGRENIGVNAKLLGVGRRQLRDRADSIIEFSGLSDAIDRPVREYSSGMFMRLGFAVAVHTDPALLLVDEVLAVGDLPFQQKCLDRIEELRSEGVGVVLITHDLGTVQDRADRALLLERGETLCEGDPAEVVNAYHRLLRDTSVPEGVADRSGDGTLELVDVRHDPSIEGILLAGTTVTTELEFKAGPDGAPAFIHGFRLLPERGSPVAAWRDPTPCGPVPPGGHVSVSLTYELHVTGGAYTVDFSLMTLDGTALVHHSPRLAQVVVAKQPEVFGVAALHARSSVEVAR